MSLSKRTTQREHDKFRELTGGTAVATTSESGGTYNSTLPTYSDGDDAQSQYDSRGRLIVTLGTALGRDIDSMSTAIATDAIMNGTTALTPKFRTVTVSTAGDNTVVSAVTDKKIRVLSAFIVASGGANTIRFESAASGTALTGQMDLADNGQLILPFSPVGWFENITGQLLNLELSAATAVNVNVIYIEV